VVEDTHYPFEDTVRFRIDPARPVEFTLVVRVPDGAGDVQVEAGDGATIRREPGRIEVSHRWKEPAEVRIDFRFTPRIERAPDGNRYVVRGPCCTPCRCRRR
jgi:DUF1680 family protein